MNYNDQRLLRTLLEHDPVAVEETRFPFAAQKRLTEQGLIRRVPAPGQLPPADPRSNHWQRHALQLTNRGRSSARRLLAT